MQSNTSGRYNPVPYGRQTQIRGLPLLHHAREPLKPYQEIIFVEAVSMTAIAEETTCTEFRDAFLKRVDFFIDRLQSAVLTGAHIMSGNSVNEDILRRQQNLFWRNNINHAATHMRGTLI